MLLSSRVSFALAVLLLLTAAALRIGGLGTLPPGLNDQEIIDIRIVESVRAGRIEAFYNLAPLGAEGGREGLYHTLLAASSTFTGSGLIGYRILSVLVGLLTLALLYAVGLRLYGPLAGLAAIALLAVSLFPVLLSRGIGRETLLPLLVAAALLGLVKALPVYNAPRAPTTLTYAALGLVLGLGFYIHPAVLLITLFSVLFIGYMVLTQQPLSRRTVSYISFAILLLIILVVPYVLSTIRLPRLAGTGRVFAGYTIDQLAPLQAVWDGMRGLFFVGDPNPIYNIPGRPLFDLISGVVILLGFLAALRYWRKPRFMLLLLALFILSPIAFLNVNSPDFHRYPVLLPVLALLFGLGVSALYHNLARRTRPLVLVGLAGLLVFNLVWTGRDFFSIWPQLAEVQRAYHTRQAHLAHHIDVTASEIPTVICTGSVFSAPPRRELTDTQLLLVMTHRKNAPVRFADCGTGMIFTSGGEHQQIIMNTPGTLDNMHPRLREWLLLGEVLNSPNLPPDGVIVLDVSQELAAQIGLFTTTAGVEYGPEAFAPSGEIYPPVRFGGNLSFLGYEPLGEAVYQPGSIVTSVNYWRVDGPPPPDMRLFTHILSDPANIVAQTDTRSVLPTQLRTRDVFMQIMFVTLPLSTPDGQYSMSVGVYQDSDRMRMAVLDGNTPRGTRLFLSENVIHVGQTEED